ncbi:hypothetical protein DFH09DRAFT_1092295 [Mycena vulgaris]|nr:hypothetical protein DFH09DRAFT_1092295 [Mycena vulgaris]
MALLMARQDFLQSAEPYPYRIRATRCLSKASAGMRIAALAEWRGHGAGGNEYSHLNAPTRYPTPSYRPTLSSTAPHARVIVASTQHKPKIAGGDCSGRAPLQRASSSTTMRDQNGLKVAQAELSCHHLKPRGFGLVKPGQGADQIGRKYQTEFLLRDLHATDICLTRGAKESRRWIHRQKGGSGSADTDLAKERTSSRKGDLSKVWGTQELWAGRNFKPGGPASEHRLDPASGGSPPCLKLPYMVTASKLSSPRLEAAPPRGSTTSVNAGSEPLQTDRQTR